MVCKSKIWDTVCLVNCTNCQTPLHVASLKHLSASFLQHQEAPRPLYSTADFRCHTCHLKDSYAAARISAITIERTIFLPLMKRSLFQSTERLWVDNQL